MIQKTRSASEAGQALIELALSLPMLFILLIGIAEFGRFAYMAIEVTNAAHAGVQYGSQNNITASDNPGMVRAATSDGMDVPGISATPAHTCACANSSGANVASPATCPVTCGSGNRIVEYVTVDTTATVSPMFSYPGVSPTLTLTGHAVMRVEQ